MFSRPLFLLLPFLIVTTRSLGFGIRPRGKPGVQPVISAETEYEILCVAIYSLTGLLAFLYVMVRFPGLGAIIAEANTF
jgi:hypothetical protein